MKHLLLLLSLACLLVSTAQTSFGTIASNRMVQKYRKPEVLARIATYDSLMVQSIWKYFTQSFTYTSQEQISVEELTNLRHFDVHTFESLRQENQPVNFNFKGIEITLKPSAELATLLAGYDLNYLLTGFPSRPFPAWVSSTTTDEDFQRYKEEVWQWARDYPEEYLEITSSPNFTHVRISEFRTFNEERRTALLFSPHIIID